MKIANELKGQIVLVKKKIKAIYSDKGISFAVSFIVLFLFFGCQARNEESNLLLNENETCFNEKLVSITKNGDKYYIGTESSGRIYVYLPEKNSLIDTLNIDCGRIYQVKQTNDADTFFVGTQNMGLKKTHQHGDSLITDITYRIKGKGDRYSCYDIFFDNDTVYAMTSHGIFKVGKSETLDTIFTHLDANGVPNPLVANNMVKASEYLFAATDSGVVVIKNHEVVDTIAEKIKIKNVAYHDSFIYALGDCLYKVDPDSLKIVDTVKLKAPARYYFYADSIHHFLSESCMILAHDSVLHNPEQHKLVYTRRKLSLEGHNVIADGKEYSLLVAENALWQVGHHYPSVFGNLKKEGGVKLACTDGKSAYFLVGKKVYKLGANNVANEVLELKDEIKLMECKQDSGIYYVNSDTCVYFQRFNQDEPEFIGKSDKEITAMCLHKSVGNGVLLGVRDGLLYMEKQKTPEPITLKMNNGNKDSIPYIRRFFVGDSIYVPTMNEGLFRGKGKTLHIVKGTENLQFIRDVAQPDSILYLLTNRHLFWGNDSIENLNHGSRLLVLGDTIYNTIYIPGEVGGVRVMRIGKNNEILSDSILFPDVSFRAESSWVLDDMVYLGGQSGVIAINSNNGETRYVKFIDKTPFPMVLLLLSFSLFTIVLLLFAIALWLREKSITIHWKNFHKESLENKIGRLRESKVYNLLDSTYQSQIDILKNDVDKLPYVKYKEKKQRSKTVSSQIDKFTMEVTHYIMDIVSERKSIYVKLANSNNSKVEEKETNEEGFDQLVSIIEYYNKHIEIEENMTKYRFILERKTIEPPEKIEKMFLYEFRKIGKEIINNIDKIISKTTYSSEKKIEELNTILNKSTHIFIENMKIHIDDMINGANNEAIERLELQTLKNELVSNDIKDMFKLVEKITIADGHLAMMKQMANIQKILKGYNETKREELHQAIENFYIPTIYYGIDLEIYKQLMEITKDEKESPKRIKGTCTLIQQAFVLLAVTMAEQKIPEKDKCNMFLSERAEGKTRERVHTVVTKWVESTFVKEELKKKANDKAGSLYSSIAAFYLNNINQKES